jgi:hypothetical protein
VHHRQLQSERQSGAEPHGLRLKDSFSCTIDSCLGNNTCAHDATACQCFVDADCNDSIGCTIDSCSASGQCLHQASSAYCINADLPQGLCNGADTCNPGSSADASGCVHQAAPLDCNDGLTCTTDSCDPMLGCRHVANDGFCALNDPLACDGIATCNPSAAPGQNPSGCEDPPGFVPCPDDGIACTEEICVEPGVPGQAGICREHPNDDYCIAQPGGCGTTCQVGVGCTRTCNITTCQGKVYQCGDCIDNDGDCRIDSGADPSCFGPCDNNEVGFKGNIPGQNNAPCKMDCYFDQDTGSGNDDCFWSHACDPHSVAPNYPPSGDNKCAYSSGANIPGTQLTCAQAQQMQSLRCWDASPGATPAVTGTDYCGDLVPNGCDCFGCCEIQGLDHAIYLGSEDASGNGSCTPETLTDPLKCKPCTQVESCRNHCDTCEVCIGRPLPPECGCQVCAAGQQLCGAPCGTPCPAGSFCNTGCCVREPQ